MDILLLVVGLLIIALLGFIAFRLPQLITYLSDNTKKNNVEERN